MRRLSGRSREIPQAVTHRRHTAARASGAPCASVLGFVGRAVPVVFARSATCTSAVAGVPMVQRAHARKLPALGSHLLDPCIAGSVAFCAKCIEVGSAHDCTCSAIHCWTALAASMYFREGVFVIS